jgi:nitroreductase
VVRDQNLLNRISRSSKAHMLESLKGSPALGHFKEHLSNPDFQIFYHAPALVVIAANEAGNWAVEDCSLAAQNLMLSAYAAGLGSCWIGFAQGWLGTPEGKAALGLPPASVPVAPIILGHPKSTPPAVPRKAPDIRWIG